jgi:hypothetical protein
MARSKYIQSVIDATRERPRSTEWYKDKIKEFGTPKPLDLIRDGKRGAKPFYGRLNMFTYNPKHRKTLPYYDTFPLVLPLERYPDGFLGINLHYLNINQRIRLLDRLVDFSSNTKFDESTRLMVLGKYQRLSKIRGVRPTIHRYLAGNVMSHFRRIDADEFTVATLLPVQRFKKAGSLINPKEVWKESQAIIRQGVL